MFLPVDTHPASRLTHLMHARLLQSLAVSLSLSTLAVSLNAAGIDTNTFGLASLCKGPII